MLNNTLGIRLTAAANNTLGDSSAVGRAAAGCTGCHFNGAYPLDLIARVLERRQGFGNDARPPVFGDHRVQGHDYRRGDPARRGEVAT